MALFNTVILFLISLSPTCPIMAASNNCSSVVVSEHQLVTYLHRNAPDRTTRPTHDYNKAVVVTIGMKLFGIRDFEEQKNTLIVEGYLTLDWVNEYLTWNNTFPYNCFPFTLLSAENLWQPNFVWLTGRLNTEVSPTSLNTAWLYSDGAMSMYPMGEISTSCVLDLQMFPFDSQICHIIIESWNYPNDQQKFVLGKFQQVPNLWVENEMWAITDNTSERVPQQYTTTQAFDRIVFTLLLQRRPLFFHINVIIPCVVIGAVEVVVFLLPLQEVGRVQISFTCLLAFSVFQNMIMGEIPRSSQRTPLLTAYVTLQMIYIGIIALLGEAWVFLMVRQARAKDDIPPPKWMFQLFRAIGSVLFIEHNLSKFLHDQTTKSRLAKSLVEKHGHRTRGRHVRSAASAQMVAIATTENAEEMMEKANNNNIPVDGRSNHIKPVEKPDVLAELTSKERWVFIAETIERTNLVTYILAITITPIVMFTILPPGKTLVHPNTTMS